MRYYCLILFTLSITALLSSCNGSFGAVIPNTGKYDGLSVRNIEISAEIRQAPGSADAIRSLIKKFNTTNEYGITVTPGESGDLTLCDASEAAAMLRAGDSVELSPLIYHPQWGLNSGRRIFYPALKRQTDYFDFARRITSVPVLMNAGVVLVNYDLLRESGFEKYPESWTGLNYLFWKTSKSEYPVFGIQGDTDSIVSIIISRGGSILRPVGFNYSINNPVVNRTLRYLRYLEDKKVLSVNHTNYLNQTMFAFGKLMTVFIQTDGIPYYAELTAMTAPGLDWDAALLPKRKPGGGAVVNTTCAGVVADGEPERELASWLFIKWLLEDEQQKRLAGLTSSLPAVQSAARGILSRPDDSFNRQWLNALKLVDSGHMNVIPGLRDYSFVSDGFRYMLERIREGEWVWLETFKLDHQIKRKRREEMKFRKVKE